jgi:hypothetical protein
VFRHEVSLTRQAKPASIAKKADLVFLVGRLPRFASRSEQPPQSKTTLTPWHRSPAFLAHSMGKDRANQDRVMQWSQVVSPDPP